MLNRIPTFVALAAIAATTACTPPDAGSPASAASLSTEMQRGSYALGYDFGESVRPGAEAIDLDAYMAGVRDGMADTSAIAWEDRQVALQRTIEEIRTLMTSNQQDLANQALEREQALLEENAARDGVIVLASGVQYEVLEEGDGPVASGPDTQVRLHYRGSLADGTEFDASYGGDPAVFSPGGMIAGFGEALQLIPMGSTWRVWIPSALAYGPAGRGEFIGPNATLIFEIEAIEIVE
jgi:FKBP-type peptidyl-prolyl cis-trans isomerase